MPSLFGDHFNSSGTVGFGEGALTEELPLDDQHKAPAGLGHARARRRIARVTAGTIAGTGDEIRMMQIKSGERLGKLLMYSDGGSAAGAVDVGLYKRGLAHDGAVIDVDLFASAQAISAAIDETDVFTEAVLAGTDRWKRAWEIATVGAASFTEDQFEDWDIVMTVTTAFTTAVSTIVLELIYTAGD